MMFHCNSKITGKIVVFLLLMLVLPVFSYAQTCVYSTKNGKYCYETKPVNTVKLVTPSGSTHTILPRQSRVITSGVISRSTHEHGSYNFEGNGYNFTGGFKFEGGLNYNGNGYNFTGNAYNFEGNAYKF